MKRFWDWYDDLEDDRPGLRMALFFGLFVCLVTIPGLAGLLIEGPKSNADVFWQWPGMLIMCILAISKVTRWPNWPKKK